MGAVREFTKRRKCREQSFTFTFPRERKDWVWIPAPALRGRDCEFLLDQKMGEEL